MEGPVCVSNQRSAKKSDRRAYCRRSAQHRAQQHSRNSELHKLDIRSQREIYRQKSLLGIYLEGQNGKSNQVH